MVEELTGLFVVALEAGEKFGKAFAFEGYLGFGKLSCIGTSKDGKLCAVFFLHFFELLFKSGPVFGEGRVCLFEFRHGCHQLVEADAGYFGLGERAGSDEEQASEQKVSGRFHDSRF